MTTCAQLLPTLFSHGAEEGLLKSSEVLASACIQAAGAVKAGFAQAKSARDAGHWSAMAGVFTFAAGILAFAGAWYASQSALRSAKIQVASIREAQDASLHFKLRETVFLAATEAVFAGLMSVSLLADPRISIDDASQSFLKAFEAFARVHLVANPQTIKALQITIHELTSARNKVMELRISLTKGGTQDDVIQKILSRQAMKSAVLLTDPIVNLVAELRIELGLPTDIDVYRDLMREASNKSQKEATAFINAITRA